MPKLLRFFALAVLTVLLRFLFDLTWWQSLFSAWLVVIVLGALLDLWIDVNQIKRQLGIPD